MFTVYNILNRKYLALNYRQPFLGTGGRYYHSGLIAVGVIPPAAVRTRAADLESNVQYVEVHLNKWRAFVLDYHQFKGHSIKQVPFVSYYIHTCL